MPSRCGRCSAFVYTPTCVTSARAPRSNALAGSSYAIFRTIGTLIDRYPECLPPHTGNEILKLLVDADVHRTPRSENLSERAIEEFLEQHWRQTRFGRMGIALSTIATTGLPGRQVLTPVNTIDLLGYQRKERTWWVVELKRDRPPDAVVGQVSRYLGWIASVRARENERTRIQLDGARTGDVAGERNGRTADVVEVERTGVGNIADDRTGVGIVADLKRLARVDREIPRRGRTRSPAPRGK